MRSILVGTVDGLHHLVGRRPVQLAGREVTALTRAASDWWAIIDGRTIARCAANGEWREVARVGEGRATCLSWTPAGLVVGTSGAHLLRLLKKSLEPVATFEAVPGRAGWYTPWGAPADARSIAVDDAGTMYVNVHVGGIVRSADGARSWQPVIDIDADVHQVVAASGSTVVAASARGLALSADGGSSWRFQTEGLHATYMRAVTVSARSVLASASSGPNGRRAAIYRTSTEGNAPFERCREGLPEWFTGNIDTACLQSAGRVAVFAAPDGAVYHSGNGGGSWKAIASGLPAVRCVAIA